MRRVNTSVIIVGISMCGFLTACDVDQTQQAKLPDVNLEGDAGQIPKYDVVKTQEGELPSVDVDVEGGQMPKFDVQGPDIDIQKKQVEVAVPKDVDVGTKKVEVDVPDVDIQTDNTKITVPTGIEITTPPDDGNDKVRD